MKRNALIRCAAWLLTLCAVMPMAMSCGDDSGKNPSSTTAGKKETETIDENDPYADRLKVSDDLGEYDFNKSEYRIVTTNNENMYWVEQETADVVDTAIYQRNRAVEERFNCVISVVQSASSADPIGYINRHVTTGDNAFELASVGVVLLGGLVPSNLFLNWYEIPNINFDKPWWSTSNTELLTHNDVCLVALGDLALNAMSASYCVYYNKRLGSDYDFPDLFEIVDNGEWTIDKITELSKDIYVDLNMDGVVDKDSDLFGYYSDSQSNMNAYLWAFDNPIFKKVGDELELVYKTEKLTSIVSKLVDTFSVYRGIQQRGIGGAEQIPMPPVLFEESRAVFINGLISQALTDFRAMDDDYSILPYPKWDEAQDEYYTMVDGLHDAMAIPVTIEDPEFVGTITEALCAESYKIVFPQYYDVALKVKGTRDPESIEMLDRIVQSRVFDFGYVFDNWKGFSFLLESQVQRKNKNIESTYKRNERSAMKWYNSILEAFENYEG